VPGKTHPLLPMPAQQRDSFLATALEELDRAAEREGVSLLMENVPASYIPKAAQLMEALDRLGSERIRVIFDVANAVFAGEDPTEGLKTVLPRLDLVHLSDTGLSSWQHATIGSGLVPFEAVAKTLDEIGYTSPTVLEVISDDPDGDIAASHEALSRLGWADRPDAPGTPPIS
jgi:L-ribulose-5-phosphate 3-epimerase